MVKTDSYNGNLDINVWKSLDSCRSNENLEGFKDNWSGSGKIIKIEEPTSYATVYEAKTEILDEKEKDFLANIVKPRKIREKVTTIVKRQQGKNNQYIRIDVMMDMPIQLPYFKANTMYKGMEVDKEYSLEELGL